ncbi:hypothetical protein BSL78_02883 [Apostichopus japonicus]|uniref:Triokinase/FMN cyclase n=1 Tax=Stichopus japonicus TaxID=307972 RepID=A0A2G8LIW2_STIJA|nr:hypothetical protein BSL78_02883 [Apostichopus japonicus]
MSIQTKKLLNDTSQCVQESLEGLVAVHPGLCMLDGYSVVIREDIAAVKAAGKVTLLSGGGSGHEPSHAGFVGRGMLSAAVAGAVFTSPPPESILAAIRAIGQNNPAGTLLIVKNYTGDRLNFGIAAERAKSEGLKVAMVIVGEDCALMSPDKSAKKRGLCGTILVHKIAGAMAEKGKSLEEIKLVALTVIESMGTIGVCLYPCSVPGSGPSFTLGASEVEVGLGIHGEAGVKRQELTPVRELIPSLVKTVLSSLGVDTKSVILIVNNLGGTTNLELTLVAKSAIESLQEAGVEPIRAYCSTFMTSLEMAGISITCLRLDRESDLPTYLDDETTAPAWPRVCTSKVSCYARNDTPSIQPEHKESALTVTQSEPLLSDIQGMVLSVLSEACKAICAKEMELNKLDSGCGDGDCGTTLKRGAVEFQKWLASKKNVPLSANQITAHLAHVSESVMGGSSGALYSIFFLAAATELKNGEH